jgi:hypothetical protein
MADFPAFNEDEVALLVSSVEQSLGIYAMQMSGWAGMTPNLFNTARGTA